MTPFTSDEVWTKLWSVESTAHGPDRLTYEHFRNFDPGARSLAQIFNICLKAKDLPDSWKHSKSIFIPKNDMGEEAEDWRPIVLSNTIAKLFARCLASRLTAWIERHEILSRCQKRFLPEG